MNDNIVLLRKRTMDADETSTDSEISLLDIHSDISDLKKLIEENNKLQKLNKSGQELSSDNDFVWNNKDSYVYIRTSLDDADKAQEFSRHPVVALSSLYEKGSIIFGTICFCSLAIWLNEGVPILHPVIALFGVISAPFFYYMGKLARKGRPH